MEFKKLELKDGESIKEIIKTAFDMELPISGGWGYTKEEATIVEDSSMPLSQLEFIFASMRATLQMSITQPKEKRYGGINVKEIKKESSGGYEKALFEVSGIKEDIYKNLIDEYKNGYGKDDFDMEAHFKKREQNTIKKVEEFWFKLK